MNSSNSQNDLASRAQALLTEVENTTELFAHSTQKQINALEEEIRKLEGQSVDINSNIEALEKELEIGK